MATKKGAGEKELRRRDRPSQNNETLRRLSGVLRQEGPPPAPPAGPPEEPGRGGEPPPGSPFQRWIEYRPAGQLKVSPLIQRLLNMKGVDELVTEWRPNSMETLMVDRMRPDLPDQGDWVVAGQHRLQAALRHEGPDFLLPCWMGWISSLDEQAQTYIDLARVIPQRHQKLFQIRVAQGEAVARAIKAVLMRHSLDLFSQEDRRHDRLWYEVGATQAAEKIFRYDGETHLENTLLLARDIWKGKIQAFQPATLVGVADFLRRYSRCRTWDRPRVVRRVSSMDIAAVKKRGRKGKLDAEAAKEYNELSYGMFLVFNAGIGPDKRLYDPDK